MKPTDGLTRGTPVRNTGRGVSVPVGDKVLGHVWNVWGQPLDEEPEDFASMERRGVLSDTARRVREAIDFSEAPEKFLFGSDWPLSPVAAYRNLVKQMFPDPQHHAAVFGGTARKLFRL